MHSSEDIPKRPKGILKKASSQLLQAQISPDEDLSSGPVSNPIDNKELTLHNTLRNAGRRTSSSIGRRTSNSRRFSGSSFGAADEDSPHLKWDETNLYLTEQEKTAKMKIDEPKTPFAPRYDPAEDEEMETDFQGGMLDAEELVVDELDKVAGTGRKRGVRDEDIPNLELGEPESTQFKDDSYETGQIVRERSLSRDSNKSEKHVVVNKNINGDVNGDDTRLTREETWEKHRQFEERRKRHYEMKNIRDILGHPEELDAIEDEDEADEPQCGRQTIQT